MQIGVVSDTHGRVPNALEAVRMLESLEVTETTPPSCDRRSTAASGISCVTVTRTSRGASSAARPWC